MLESMELHTVRHDLVTEGQQHVNLTNTSSFPLTLTKIFTLLCFSEFLSKPGMLLILTSKGGCA